MSASRGSTAKTSNFSSANSPAKSNDEPRYLIQVWCKGSWVDRDGTIVYDGAVQTLGRFKASGITQEAIEVLVMAYCDTYDATIWYLPPNGDMKNDVQFVKDDAALTRVFKRQGQVFDVTLFAMPSFDNLIWYRTPFMEKLRLSAVGPQFNQSGKRPTGIVIGTPRRPTVEEPVVIGKGKGKMYEERPVVDDGIDMSDLRDYDLSESDQSWTKAAEPYDDDSDDSDDLGPKSVKSAKSKSAKSKSAKSKSAKSKTAKSHRKKQKQPGKKKKVKKECLMIASMSDFPGFGKYNYGTHVNQEDANRFMDLPGFGGDSDILVSDSISAPPLADLVDDATTGVHVGSRYREHLGGDFELELGMKFDDANTFRKAIKLHAIKRGTSTVRRRNNADRIEVACQKNCGFLVIASRMNRDSTFEIRTLQKNHSCDRAHYTKDIGKQWVCENFKELLRAQGNLKANAIASEIRRLLEFNVSKYVIYEGMKMAKEILAGDRRAEFAMSRDYAETLVKHNPGSTAVVHVQPSPSLLRSKFERMYVCLDACMKGFRIGCRPFIALDGAFLKGPDGGFILSAVTRDANDQLFPIAYAWAESENASSWRWFLEILARDIGNDRTLTIMSDRQKGLVQAVEEFLPGSEHRFCVRHIHSNMKARSMGSTDIGARLWSAACAYTEHRHNHHMDILKKININAWQFLKAIDSSIG